MAQFGSAFGWGPKGRKFKSCRPDQANSIHFTIKVKWIFLLLSNNELFNNEDVHVLLIKMYVYKMLMNNVLKKIENNI